MHSSLLLFYVLEKLTRLPFHHLLALIPRKHHRIGLLHSTRIASSWTHQTQRSMTQYTPTQLPKLTPYTTSPRRSRNIGTARAFLASSKVQPRPAWRQNSASTRFEQTWARSLHKSISESSLPRKSKSLPARWTSRAGTRARKATCISPPPPRLLVSHSQPSPLKEPDRLVASSRYLRWRLPISRS